MLSQLLLAAGEATENTTPPAETGVTFASIWNSITQWALNTGIKILIAIIILLITFKIINVISKKIDQKSKQKNHDKTLMHTLAYLFKIIMKILVCICLIGYVGIDTSGLTALVTSIGVCVGLAINGALANFAGGVLLILTRPFKIDDYIEAQGVSGTVEDIRIISTKIRTPDNKVIYLPNGSLSTGNIMNYSEEKNRRVDMMFSIGYNDDFEKAKQIIEDICKAHEMVLPDPAPFVRVKEHGASSINIVARVWAENRNYWTVYFDIMEQVKTAFDKEGIEIPYNQLDVHVKND